MTTNNNTSTNATQEEVSRFWRHLFGSGRGLLQVWTAKRDEHGDLPKETIQSNLFNYPGAAQEAAAWALKKAEKEREVYFCAHLLTSAQRIKENASEVLTLWCELDGAEVPNGSLAPTAVVESSPGHYHCYWRLTDPIPPGTAEGLNQRLAHEIGADSSGFDLTQLLRVPGSVNHKYKDRPVVAVQELNTTLDYEPGELDTLLPKIDTPEEEYAPESQEEPPVHLSATALEVWRGEDVKYKDDGSGAVDRSASLLKVGRVLYDAGANRSVIVAALAERDAALGWRKYTDRADANKCYADIFDKELAKNGRNEHRAGKKLGGQAQGDSGFTRFTPSSGGDVNSVNQNLALNRASEQENHGFTPFTPFPREINSKLPEPLPFPVKAMPASCQKLITEGAAAIGCPADFIAMAMLVTLGSAIGNSRRAQVKRGWTEGAGIYGAVIAIPGEKKTAAQALATGPAIKEQIKLREEHREKMEKYKQDMRDGEVEKKAAHKNGEAAPPPPEKPIMERTAVGDVTIEAMASILDENPRGVGMFRDELVAWIKGMDQYKAGGKGAERQFWLSTWSNALAQFDRKGQEEPTIIPRPFVGVFGSIQPDVLPELHSNRGDGMLERFVFSYPQPVLSDWSDADVSWEAELSYENLYNRLRGLQVDEDKKPVSVEFEEDAKELFVVLFNEHQAQRRAPGFPKILQQAWPKLEAYLVRLSLILAMSRSAGGVQRITRDDVADAASLVGYLKNHAYRVYSELYGEDPKEILTRDLVRFLVERGGYFRGQPSELFEAFHSRAKPKNADWLARNIKEIADLHHLHHSDSNTENLVIHYKEGHEAVLNPETKTGKTTRRFVEIVLENSENHVNLFESWMGGF
jgi:hypothetical protein